MGDEIDTGDYPPGMLSKDEENELQEFVDEKGQAMTLYNISKTYYTEIERFDSLSSTLLGQLFNTKQYFKMSDHDKRQIKKALRPELSEFYPSDQWIFRNLTTREYVRHNAIVSMGIGNVILSRVCWSTSSSVSMANGGNIHRGIWAGHRFDITTLARHREGTKEDEWRDISEEVAKEITRIWGSECPSEDEETGPEDDDFASVHMNS